MLRKIKSYISKYNSNKLLLEYESRYVIKNLIKLLLYSGTNFDKEWRQDIYYLDGLRNIKYQKRYSYIYNKLWNYHKPFISDWIYNIRRQLKKYIKDEYMTDIPISNLSDSEIINKCQQYCDWLAKNLSEDIDITQIMVDNKISQLQTNS